MKAFSKAILVIIPKGDVPPAVASRRRVHPHWTPWRMGRRYGRPGQASRIALPRHACRSLDLNMSNSYNGGSAMKRVGLGLGLGLLRLLWDSTTLTNITSCHARTRFGGEVLEQHDLAAHPQLQLLGALETLWRMASTCAWC